MPPQDFDQLKSYVTLIVYELHKVIFDEAVFDKLKPTLRLAEEMEVMMMGVKRRENVVEFKNYQKYI